MKATTRCIAFTITLLSCLGLSHDSAALGQRPPSHDARHQAAIESKQRQVEAAPTSALRDGGAGGRIAAGGPSFPSHQPGSSVPSPKTPPPSLTFGNTASPSISLAGTPTGQPCLRSIERVNPHDVENAAWHFLCIAKSKGLDRGRSMTLPAPGDSRIPMEQVLVRLKGGDSRAIDAASVPTGGNRETWGRPVLSRTLLGLIADAEVDHRRPVGIWGKRPEQPQRTTWLTWHEFTPIK